MNEKTESLHLWRFVRRYTVGYLIAFLAMVFSTLLDMVFPIVMQHIVDDVLIARNMQIFKFLLLAVLAVGIGRFM